jgi:PTS system ascorbate-specific IIA component
MGLPMPAFVIVAHAPLASSLKAVAEHTYAECAPEISAVDVAPGESAELLEARVQAAVDGREAILFVDTLGATPANAAGHVADGRRVRIVAGVNVPMLWRTLCYRNLGLGLDELVAKALDGGVRGISTVAPEGA